MDVLTALILASRTADALAGIIKAAQAVQQGGTVPDTEWQRLRDELKVVEGDLDDFLGPA